MKKQLSLFALLISAAITQRCQSQDVQKAAWVHDWSHRHVVFSNPGTEDEARENGTRDRWSKLNSDPRYQIQQQSRRAAGHEPEELRDRRDPRKPDRDHPSRSTTNTLDWSMLSGTNAVGHDMFPAKWSFSVGTASCSSDFVVYPTGTTGSGTQATITAYGNLYSGCGGTVPNVYWQYNTGGGSSSLSPIFSRDGTQVAFIQNASSTSRLVLLKWAQNYWPVTLASSGLERVAPLPRDPYLKKTRKTMRVMISDTKQGEE